MGTTRMIENGAVKNIAETFSAFATDLARNKAAEVALIAEAGNGFEGWLKVEFYAWLRSHGLSAEEVGMEYRLNKDSSIGTDKRCDLWVRAPGNERYHYVELKVPFASTNRGKMLRFGGTDLWHMMNIDSAREGAASGNAILVGVDFNKNEWTTGRETVRRAACIPGSEEPKARGEIGARLRWDVWSHDY